MNQFAIQVENLSKRYRIGSLEARYGSLRENLANTIKTPFKWLHKSGSSPSESQHIWALKDISFEIKPGDAVGIIGRNGAGKSTLLKVISRITRPTSGKVKLFGRVGSLLEVGTGFHPELTGRENIYLNGAILGMHKSEINRKFDEIVDFAEVEQFLDTPVKHYSSGMYMRLAFAVAAHLEPEILLVDEILAVGDIAFQKKCLGKMGEVAQGGRTVLFVSHNMPAVMRLCPRTMVINNGEIKMFGESKQAVDLYLKDDVLTSNDVVFPSKPEKSMCLRRVTILDYEDKPSVRLQFNQSIKVKVEFDINKNVTGAHIICFIFTNDGINVFGTGDADCSPDRLLFRQKGKYCGEFVIPGNLLGEGFYYITVSLGIPYVQVYDRHESIVGFEIIDNESNRREWQHLRRPGILGIEIPWIVEKIN